jgi:hypothetical protein
MKRDPELIRKIILAVEAAPEELVHFKGLCSLSEPEKVVHHLWLLKQSGLATVVDLEWGPVTTLTSAGHDFADLARDQKTWDDVMRMGEASLPIATIQALLEKSLKRSLLL